MINREEFKGIIPPVVTIFNEEGDLDKKGMGDLIDSLISSGVNGLLLLGSSGEFNQMSLEQRKNVASFGVSYVDGRVPVLIGTGSNNTQESIILSQHAQEIKADGVVIINPYYWQLTEQNIINHYSDIAKSISIPVLLYNFPDRSGQDLTPRLVLKIVEKNSNIIGIKETVDSASHIREMIFTLKEKYPNFKVFSGFDDYVLNTLQIGGDGAILGSSNFAADLAVKIYNDYINEDYKEAISKQRKLSKLAPIFAVDSPIISPIKEAIKMSGLNISTHVLPPAKQLDKISKQTIYDTLKDATII